MATKTRARNLRPTRVLDNMKVALLGMQLLRRHFLNGERVVGSVGDYDVAVAVIVGGCQ